MARNYSAVSCGLAQQGQEPNSVWLESFCKLLRFVVNLAM